ITDENNIPIIEASTAWILANPITRQILRPSSFTGKVDLNPEKFANVKKVGRLKIDEENLIFIGERKIVYSDIDANGHLYNAFYADIAYDFLPENFTQKDLIDFAINFKQEAKLQDIIKIYMSINENTVSFIGKLQNIISFECVLTFE
ncbi:MAG: thioesterase, partial [Oscillospiraceae bacterium]